MKIDRKPSRFHLRELLARPDAAKILDERGRIQSDHPALRTDPEFSIINSRGEERIWKQSELRRMRSAARAKNGHPFGFVGAQNREARPPSPADAGALQDFSASPYMNPLFPGDQGVQMERSDCYYIAPATSLAQLAPGILWTIGKQTGKNEYRTRFSTMPAYPDVSGQFFTDVFNDDMLPTGQALLGDDGSKWMKCFERAYAYFRTGANLYASTDWGWAAGTLEDWGIVSSSYTTLFPGLITLVMSALSTSPCVVGSTYADTGNTGIVPSHVYSIRSVDPVAGTFLCDNPWKGYGAVVVPLDVFVQAFSTVTVARTVTFPVDPTFTPFSDPATPPITLADPASRLLDAVTTVRTTLQGLIDQIAAHKAAHP